MINELIELIKKINIFEKSRISQEGSLTISQKNSLKILQEDFLARLKNDPAVIFEYDDNHWSLLHFVSAMRNSEISEIFAQNIINLAINLNILNIKSEDRENPLHIAALANFNILNMKAKDGETPLHIAALAKNEKLVSFFIKNNVDTSIINNDGSTPLHNAIRGGEKKIVAKLIDAQTDPINKQCILGLTPLMIAVENNDIEIIKLLIRKNADINAINNQTGETALHISIRDNIDIDIIQLLIDYNIDTKIQDLEGMTAYDKALENGEIEIINILGNRAKRQKKENNQYINSKIEDTNVISCATPSFCMSEKDSNNEIIRFQY